VNSAPS